MDEKKKKNLKILAYALLLILTIVAIVLCIVTAVYKDKTKELEKKNEQFHNSQSVCADIDFKNFMIENWTDFRWKIFKKMIDNLNQ